MSVLIILLAILSFVVVKRKINNFYRKRAANLPPLAGGALPIVGHTFLALSRRERLYEIIFQTILGPAFKNGADAATIRIGTCDAHVLLDPDDMFLLVNSCLKKDPFYELFESCFGKEGLITANASIWKKHRKLLNPTFNQNVLDTYLTEFNQQSQQFAEKIAQEAGQGFFDPLPYLRHTTLQIVCATIMGVDVEDEEDLIKEVGEASDLFTSCMFERVRKFWYHNDFLFRFSNIKKKQDSAAKTLQDLAYKVLRKKKAELIAQGDKPNKSKDTSKSQFKSLLHLLLDLSKDNTLSDSEIQGEMHTFIGAAFDTTYHALGFTLLTLGSYPEVQKKVLEEQLEVFEGTKRDVERQDLSKLKYLEAVIKETMRLYPVILGVGRIPDNDMKFKKYTLPAGSRCFASIYHVCRHPVWGPDAEQFRPERWLDGSLPSNARAYAVFGLGKRSCIGSNFAMMVMKIVMSHMVRRYHITGDVTQLVQELSIVVTPVSGHHIALELRKDQKQMLECRDR